MKQIYLTGDIHGTNGIHRLGTISFNCSSFDRTDYVIILGDFGFLWTPYPSKEELWWLDWIDKKPWTTLVVDGNHENHERFSLLPTIKMFDSKVGRISKNIYHLRRGHIYNIPDVNGNHSFFVMGGALSIDKAQRSEGITWWSAEIPSYAEFELGLKNLENRDWKVDYILGHTGPANILTKYLHSIGLYIWDKSDKDAVAKYFNNVCAMTEFNRMYFGHMHDNWVSPDKNYHMLYDHIVQLGTFAPKNCFGKQLED